MPSWSPAAVQLSLNLLATWWRADFFFLVHSSPAEIMTAFAEPKNVSMHDNILSVPPFFFPPALKTKWIVLLMLYFGRNPHYLY